MKKRISRIICTLLCCAPIAISAQTSEKITSPVNLYKEGKELFQEKASRWNTTLLITGKEDMIVSANKCEFITNGTPAMSQITGTGCMLGMICATYLAVAAPFTAALSAAREFGTAGERAEKNSSGPGSFQTELFDQFYNLL